MSRTSFIQMRPNSQSKDYNSLTHKTSTAANFKNQQAMGNSAKKP